MAEILFVGMISEVLNANYSADITETPFEAVGEGLTISAKSTSRPRILPFFTERRRTSTSKPPSLTRTLPPMTSRRPPPAVFRPAATARTVPPRFIPERPRSVATGSVPPRNTFKVFGKEIKGRKFLWYFLAQLNRDL